MLESCLFVSSSVFSSTNIALFSSPGPPCRKRKDALNSAASAVFKSLQADSLQADVSAPRNNPQQWDLQGMKYVEEERAVEKDDFTKGIGQKLLEKWGGIKTTGQAIEPHFRPMRAAIGYEEAQGDRWDSPPPTFQGELVSSFFSLLLVGS